MIIDGFQPAEAVAKVKGKNASIDARICDVDHNTAAGMAAAANQKHGQQLEKADRVKIIKTRILTFPEKSNGEIAKLAFVSEGTIRKYRKGIPEAQSETRIGADGRQISSPKKK